MSEKSKFKSGDRVYHNLLGWGYVREVNFSKDKKRLLGLTVMFDNTPPFRYNCSTNPCFVFPETLRFENEFEPKN